MIINCHQCHARVDSRVLAEHDSQDEGDAPKRVWLCECPQCEATIVAVSWVDDPPERVWPEPEAFHYYIPSTIRASLEEAGVCYGSGAYNAAMVMAGRAIEGICRHFGSAQTSLGPGIREMREKGIIDGRIARWAEELQKARNLGAHAGDERVSQEDARDLLDFARAICDYVFVLTKKFEEFLERRATTTGDASLLQGLRLVPPPNSAG